MTSNGDVADRLEQLQLKHKQERKELQGRVIAMRKSVTKPDKNRKKALSLEIDSLEKDMSLRHRQELDSLTLCQNVSGVDGPGDGSTLEASVAGSDAGACGRVSRAQRWRDKKEHESRERRQRIAEAEQNAAPSNRSLETQAITAKLAARGLAVRQIASDGDCMYAALCHQLSIKPKSGSSPHSVTTINNNNNNNNTAAMTVANLRRLVAAEMRSQPARYLHFLPTDGASDCVSDAHYQRYVQLIEQTPAWGGQVELAAASVALDCDVCVVQADGSDIWLRPEQPAHNAATAQHDEHAALVIVYHRHMYALGEHYNSTSPLPVSTATTTTENGVNDDNSDDDKDDKDVALCGKTSPTENGT